MTTQCVLSSSKYQKFPLLFFYYKIYYSKSLTLNHINHWHFRSLSVKMLYHVSIFITVLFIQYFLPLCKIKENIRNSIYTLHCHEWSMDLQSKLASNRCKKEENIFSKPLGQKMKLITGIFILPYMPVNFPLSTMF